MRTIVRYFTLTLFILLNWSLFTACNNEQQEAPTTAETNTNQLSNSPVGQTLAAYYDLSDAFVNWDTAAIQARATTLQERLETVQNDSSLRLQNSNTLNTLTKEARDIKQQQDITQQRRTFDKLSQEFYTWLNQNNYSGSTVYLQECPMAFNDEEKGHWLSSNDAIRNPYLGLHHPKYKKGMLECGTIKDSIQRR